MKLAEVTTPGDTTTPSPHRRSLFDPPGGVLMWLIVALELLVFAMVFGLIAWLRTSDPEAFRAEQLALDPTFGLILTVTLVTSGWFAAEAVHAFRANRIDRARRWYAAAVAAGVGFAGLKIYDYAAKIGAGHGLGSGDFWDAYLLGTGFHFAHVLVGIGLLAYAGLRIGRVQFEDVETSVAGTTLFWHMCDIAWFFLFPLFYVRS